ncbi:MAG: GNAT family N-acetyltransferase [Burkholderiales bacterium]|nr:GNAT family N-acetyltransferase [Burkholderiales bacterium]
MTVLTTARLRLEPMADAHFEGLRVMNADPEVMRYILGRPETPEETRHMIERVQARWARCGYAGWTFIERETGVVAGAGCLQNLRRQPAPEPDPTCPIEIGWRLRRDRWGRGLATEAAQAMAIYAFDVLKTDPLLACCEPANTASSHVMSKLGMHCRGLETWYGRERATYEVSAATWRATAQPKRTA